jgi:hypothetical protein
LPLAIAPKLRLSEDTNKVLISRSTENGTSVLDVSCEFSLGDRRRVYLILSGDVESYQIPQERDEIGTGQLTPRFNIGGVQSGEYWLRLRADGVDSLIVKQTDDGLEFDHDTFKVQL